MHPIVSISVITPVYNELTLLEPGILRIDGFLSEHFSDYEILIIESGSTDGTWALSNNLAARVPRVSVVHEGARRGFGSALRLGFSRATKDLVWPVTVDLPFPLETILRVLPLLDRYDCVLSYRTNHSPSLSRRFLSWGYNTLVKAVLGLKVRHVNSAFKLFRRSLIQSFPLTANGWLIDAEILCELTRREVPYVEIPVALVPRTAGLSSITVGIPFVMLRELLSLKQRKGRTGGPGRD